MNLRDRVRARKRSQGGGGGGGEETQEKEEEDTSKKAEPQPGSEEKMLKTNHIWLHFFSLLASGH